MQLSPSSKPGPLPSTEVSPTPAGVTTPSGNILLREPGVPHGRGRDPWKNTGDDDTEGGYKGRVVAVARSPRML